MKRGHQGIARASGTQEIVNAILHLIRSFVGKRDRQNLLGTDTAILDQVRHTIGDHARLPAAGSGQNQYRPFRGFSRFELFRIKDFRQVHTCGRE